MILGRGAATTQESLLAEYRQLVLDTRETPHTSYHRALKKVPLLMCEELGKPVFEWNENDILSLYQSPVPSWRKGRYTAFLAFLIFRGYYRPSVSLLLALGFQLSSHFRPALEPHRQWLLEAQQRMGYRLAQTNSTKNGKIGSELELYVWLLAVCGKTANEITRADFDRFREDYEPQYRSKARQENVRPHSYLYRLERILEHQGMITERKREIHHESYFDCFPPSFIRDAIVQYVQWCTVRSPKGIYNRRKGVEYFLDWISEHHTGLRRLDEVKRPLALAYAHYLKQMGQESNFSVRYQRQLYHTTFLFFEDAIEHHLETAPVRNPFSLDDVPTAPNMVPRYLPDHELRPILQYCEHDASLLERTLIITLLHTGIRASELALLKVSDLVQIGGRWKLHIHEGKGLKDRVIPLTAKCVAVLQEWLKSRPEPLTDAFFSYYGKPWSSGHQVQYILRKTMNKLGLVNVTAHRFRHTFAVALLNYGVRESALQKLMGHATLGMTLEYARILDETVERSFSEAVEQMQEGAMSWLPNFFAQEDYTLFAEGDSVSWIQLPVGFCRRNPKLHCESDVKCFLCERFCATPKDLPRLQQMYPRDAQRGVTSSQPA
jgi:integrase